MNNYKNYKLMIVLKKMKKLLLINLRVLIKILKIQIKFLKFYFHKEKL